MVKNVIRTIGKLLISFLMSVLLATLGVTIVLYATLLNPEFAIRQADSGGYATGLCNDIKEDFIGLGDSGGLPATVFDNLLTVDSVRADFDGFIRCFYVGKTYQFDSTTLSDTLKQRFLDESRKSGQALTPQVEQNITGMIPAFVEDYQARIAVPSLSKIGSSVAKLREILPKASAGLAFVVIVLGTLLFWMEGITHSKNSQSESLSNDRRIWLPGAVFGSGLMLIAAPLVFLWAKIPERINITSSYQAAFLSGLLNKTLLTFILAGVVLIVMTISCILVSGVRKK